MHKPVARTLIAAAAAAAVAGAHAQAGETVTITGNGRAQEVQSVPIAVQLVTSEQIDKLAATNLASMNGYLPGLEVNAEQPTQPIFTLRGIGSGDFGIGTDAPVGVYVDGVYTGKTGGALINFNDVKRIEVLKGPQGTLFGRNSVGGAIAIVTNDPVGTFAAKGLLRLGQWNTRHAEAVLNQPLSDAWALRVSGTVQHSSGWQKDAATGRDERGENAWGTRIALGGGVGEATRVVLSWEHELLDQRALPSIGLLAAPAFNADPATYLDPRRAPLRNDAAANREWRRFDGVTLRIDSTLAGADFTSTTAWRHFNAINRTDNDGSNRPDTYLATGNVEGNTTWQQEFRLAGRNATVDWLAGTSFFVERARQTSEVATNTASLDTLFGNLAGVAPYATINALAQGAGVPGVDVLGLPWQEDMVNRGRYEAWALYGDAIWHLTPQTNVTTGLRFTHDRKRFGWVAPARQAAALDAQLGALAAADFFPTMVGAGAISQADADQLQALVTGNQLINGAGAPLTTRTSWNNWSPRLVLDHRLTPQTMVYASVTRGYQAGGYNALQVNGRYQPETVTSYEVGAKGELRGAGLTYSAALFQYRFENLQSLTLVPSGNPNGVPAYEVAVSNQRASGADVEARWQATRALKLYGAAEFISQRYRHHVGADGTDLSGQPVGTPLWTVAAGADLRWALGPGQANATLQGAYTGATRCNGESATQGTCLQAPAFRVGGPRTRIDARLGWDSAPAEGRGAWGVALVVNNLADRRYVNSVSYVAAGLGSPYATISPPRWLGVELRASL